MLKHREDEIIGILKGDLAHTAAKKRHEINEANMAYAADINRTMQLVLAAGATGVEDLSAEVATTIFRDALQGHDFPKFEERLPNGKPRLRADGTRLDGLRTVEGRDDLYPSASVAWRIRKILTLLRRKTPIKQFDWEKKRPFRPRIEEMNVPVAEAADISLPAPKRGRPSRALEKLRAAKAKQEVESC